MNDSDERGDRTIERIEEEHISTADLAGAGRGPREEENDARIGGTPVEIVSSPENDERDPDRPRPVQVQRPSTSAPTGAAAAPVQEPARRQTVAEEQNSGPLFSADEAAKLRQRWDAIQVGFVDEPRKSVEEADSLVATVMKRLAEQFAAERSKLEGHWDRGSDVSTEDLRLALRRYRSFFGRLLNV